MNRLIIIFLILCPFFAPAQQRGGVLNITRDSLPTDFMVSWKFHEGDSMQWSDTQFNDSLWEDADQQLGRYRHPQKPSQRFSSVAWLRLRIHVDSGVNGIPLTLAITHYGASQIYFDGKKLKSYGVIKGKDSSEYCDPQSLPFAFIIHDTGEHVIAVRYANYDAEKLNKRYNRSFAGFKLRMDTANHAIYESHRQALAVSIVLIFLFGIFFALSLIHMLLYLYYKAARSNLYFSIFSMSLSLLFFLPFLSRVTNSATVEAVDSLLVIFFITTACFSFSGFSNELFSKSKLRFVLVALFCLVAFVSFVVHFENVIMLLAMVTVVTLESVILNVRAIYRRVPGARIVGVGLLLFGSFFLIITVMAVVYNTVEISENTLSGQLLELLGVAAILCMPLSMSAYLAWNFGAINKDLKSQLQQVKELSDKNLEQEREKKQMLENRQEELEKEVSTRTAEVMVQKQEIEQQHKELKVEKKKSDDLLLNILPEEVAEELKQKGTSEAKFFDRVSVIFTDFVDFTKAGEFMSPEELVGELHMCFKAFDDIISKHGIEKIKTIGDAYMAVCGLPAHVENHAHMAARAAIEIREFMALRKQQLGDKTFDIRIGIHSGSVVAGIVGVKKFAYDIWGDTVNTAARMEQNSETGRINVSEVTWLLIRDKFECTYRGEIAAKNKGVMNMYFIEREK